ncbi:Folate transporter 1, chloroplastic-like protein [Drosera capensis]
MAAASPSSTESTRWQWENGFAGAVAGFATVAAMHPLDVVRTRFQVNDGRVSHLPGYNNTPHALFTIARYEGLKGLYAGFYPAVLGSTISWGLYFFFYSRAKQRYSKNRVENLSPGLHLAAAAEAGALVSLCTNPIWLIKTRLQLQTPLHESRPYNGLHGLHVSGVLATGLELKKLVYAFRLNDDALRTILKEEGWTALYKGIMPALFLVSHGAIQFTAYEELRKVATNIKSEKSSSEATPEVLNSLDYAFLGATSKVIAILFTYPFQVVRARLQQRPNRNGIPRYADSWHVIKETARFEGVRGFYKGITANLLKNVPASSITFIVYENVLRMLKLTRRDV